MPPGERQVKETTMGLDQLIPEEKIRARSYAMWSAEGCREGCSEEYWFRALAELEIELVHNWLTAIEEHEKEERNRADFVMPRPPISRPIYRHEAGRIGPECMPEAA